MQRLRSLALNPDGFVFDPIIRRKLYPKPHDIEASQLEEI